MSAPAGWYPDPAGGARRRWWDGAQWTQHLEQTATPAAPPAPSYGVAAYPTAGAPYLGMPKADVETNTIWVWLAIVAAALPVLSVFLIDWSGYFDAILRTTSAGPDVRGILEWQMRFIGISLISWAAIGVSIVFCWLDCRELRRRGVAAPFHWGWSFFSLLTGGAAVYMIGRAVVLRRRTVAGGTPPLVGWIITTVATWVFAVVWTFWMVEAVLQHVGGVYS